ncbi:MAG: phosphoribosylformylglycinamidine synthase, partial [Myxococcota bacterium]|nr:phosphoribosylformylglycinamidine synthase [Myxococcota bacterium]
MLRVPGRAALGASRRARAFAKAKLVSEGVLGLDSRWIHLVASERPLTADEATQLERMLAYGPQVESMPPAGPRDGAAPERNVIWVTPRLGTISPWSSKATDIAHVCGLASITRIERVLEYTLIGHRLDLATIGGALSDRMTESVILRDDELAAVIEQGGTPRPLGHVALGTDGVATLRAASKRLGLALADDEIEYLV